MAANLNLSEEACELTKDSMSIQHVSMVRCFFSSHFTVRCRMWLFTATWVNKHMYIFFWGCDLTLDYITPPHYTTTPHHRHLQITLPPNHTTSKSHALRTADLQSVAGAA